MEWGIVRKVLLPILWQRTQPYKISTSVRFEENSKGPKKPKHAPGKSEPFCPKQSISVDEVTLSIGNTVLVAEKQRLIQSSPYFNFLVRYQTETNPITVSMVPPENVQTSAFLAVVFSLCNANSKLEISPAIVCDIIVLSKYFELEQLEENCLNALRKMLPTLGMDELCRLWRNGNTYGFRKVTSLALVGISLKMQEASQCGEFLDFSVKELVALMSDDMFLPLLEKDACMAVLTWFEQDPETRKKPGVLSLILPHVVWDASSEHLLQPLIGQREKPEKLPKRAATSGSSENDSPKVLEKVGCSDGIVAGDYVYAMDRPRWDRKFLRINWRNGERTAWEPPAVQWEGDECDEPAQYRFCLVQFAGRTNIGCLISYSMDISHNKYHYAELNNTIALCDTAGDTWEDPPLTQGKYILEGGFLPWQYLPTLPLPRKNPAMIQCGTFLYVIGGMEYKPYVADTGNAHHVYRLDLRRLTKDGGDEEYRGEWERTADLNAPRIEHSVKIHYGRIIVSGGKTETTVDSEGKKTFESARWSEAYDTTLNAWTMFDR